jgi:RNA recognition motif-containing protein
MKKRSLITTAATLCASALTAIPSTNAFAPQQPIMVGAPLSSSQLAARSNGIALDESNDESSRRDVLKSSVGALFAGLTLAANIDVEPASASYTAYTNREKDWEQRQKSGGKFNDFALEVSNQLSVANFCFHIQLTLLCFSFDYRSCLHFSLRFIHGWFGLNTIYRHQSLYCPRFAQSTSRDRSPKFGGEQNFLPKWSLGCCFSHDGK